MLTKKAQTSTEMLLIISAGLIVIIGIVIVIQDSLVGAQFESNKRGTERIFDYVKNEITSAINSPFAYNSTILIPDTLENGKKISIKLNPPPDSATPGDITIIIEETEYVRYYWNLTLDSEIQVGKNIISKQNPLDAIKITY